MSAPLITSPLGKGFNPQVNPPRGCLRQGGVNQRFTRIFLPSPARVSFGTPCTRSRSRKKKILESLSARHGPAEPDVANIHVPADSSTVPLWQLHIKCIPYSLHPRIPPLGSLSLSSPRHFDYPVSVRISRWNTASP